MAQFACPSFSTELRVNLGAIRANYRHLSNRAAPAACGAVVKADAYGLGLEKVAPALYREGCRIFFVAQLCEAFDLTRVVGRDSRIFILNGVDPGSEEACEALGFVPVLNSPTQVERWRALARARGRALPAALQIDSGMSRLGMNLQSWAELKQDSCFEKEVSPQLIMTHLACAEDRDNRTNARQLVRFQKARELFPGIPGSIANSAGVYLSAAFRSDVVRPGIALYGSAPAAHSGDVQPVVYLCSRVLQLRDIARGEGVGYGHDYVAPGPRRLATIGIGYGDGWPRILGGAGAAWFQGTRLPIVGRISMDSLTVDVSQLPPARLAEGDFVELLGPSQSLQDVARDAGTIAYEILTSLGARHKRVYVDRNAIDILAPGGVR